MTAFEVALEHLLDRDVEGGEANIKGDPGGHTKWGMSTPAWRAFLKRKNRPLISVANAIEADAKIFYREGYWDPTNCYLLPPWAGILVFDVTVHSGAKKGVRLLQKVADPNFPIPVDGVIGPQTLGAIEKKDPLSVIRRFCDQRALDLDAIDRRMYQGRLSRGFAKRVRRLQEHAMLCALEVSPWKVK